MEIELIYIVAPLIGFVGMLSGGYWGIGCGWIIVPTMLIFGVDTLSAVGIGLLQMIPSTVMTAAKQIPHIGWGKGGYGRALAVPICGGALLTSLLGKNLNTAIMEWAGSPEPIQWFLIVFIGIIAIQTIFSRTPGYDAPITVIKTGQSIFALIAGLFTGLISSMLGVGGGILIRPLLSSVFKLKESFTGRITRVLVLITSIAGGTTYLLKSGTVDWHMLNLAGAIAVGGMFGFPLGSKIHHVVYENGYAQHIHKSFGVVTIIVPISTILKMYGYTLASQIIVLTMAFLLGLYLALFARYAKKHPLR
ncbi:MAG: sulfite exporter TauE/SafE family protein [Victivallaceae bacterium]|nr:sulfite exporter TauE/SafE family protein [Victivallaceae bacterium]